MADLTGLDPIGLPVWASYRPNARSLSVCQGKGLSSGQARLSAVMEAIETALAESAERLSLVAATADEMRAGGKPIVPLELMTKCQDPRLALGKTLQWIEGSSLRTNEPVWAPYELVGLDWRKAAPWHRDAFKMSSVGLSAHFARDNAILHGLLEAIEYDAVALAFAWPGILEHLPVLDHERCVSPGLKLAVDRVCEAGFEPTFVDISTDIELPAVLCILEGPSPTHDRRRAAPFAGHACRLDCEEAMLAALLEAVQTQATDISGARDDIRHSDYALGDPLVPAPDRRAGSTNAKRAPDLASLVSCQPADRQIAFVRSRLGACGIDDVFVFDLNGGEFDVACVSVVCPRLEVGTRAGGWRPGKRARMRIVQHALGRP